jgi:hypothetical protein
VTNDDDDDDDDDDVDTAVRIKCSFTLRPPKTQRKNFDVNIWFNVAIPV